MAVLRERRWTTKVEMVMENEDTIPDDLLLRFENACYTGDHVLVERLCRLTPAIASKAFDWKGKAVKQGSGAIKCTGLHLAVSQCHSHCCRVLLDAGADIEATDSNGRTPLMCVGNQIILELLLSRGANARATGFSGWTTLHYCARYGWNVEAVRSLVVAGANVNAETDKGNTPLMLAVAEYRADRQARYGSRA